MDENLVYVGKIISLDKIENADFIVSATVVCGAGGKWRGIVKKDQFNVTDKCIVYMPDAIIPESKDMQFMASSNWRVKMRRFRGAASEVVIMPLSNPDWEVGSDWTQVMGVTKYHKPLPAHLNGIAIGQFPGFIPKTDEPNYQREDSGVKELVGKPYYVTVKYDGSSTTAFKYKGEFGLCSRNLQLAYNPDNGYWKVADKYDLENKLPEGIALQWETCGPGIQSNPMGLTQIEGFAFSAYNIIEHRYLEMIEFWTLIDQLKFPIAELTQLGVSFDSTGIEFLGEGMYKTNKKQREGVVVRSQQNLLGGKPISFKVINLNYEK